MTAGLAASELARLLGDDVAPNPSAAATRPGTLAGLRAPLRGKAWVRGRRPGYSSSRPWGGKEVWPRGVTPTHDQRSHSTGEGSAPCPPVGLRSGFMKQGSLCREGAP